MSASRVNIGLRLKPTAGSASPSIARLIHAQILDAKQHSGSSALTPLDAVGSKEPTTNSIIQRCISARHQSAVEWRTLCHGRACTAGRTVRPTEAKMRGEIEQFFCFPHQDAAAARRPTSTHLPSTALLDVRTFTRTLLCLDSGAVARAGKPPAQSIGLRCEPSLASQLEKVHDSGSSWWAVMSP